MANRRLVFTMAVSHTDIERAVRATQWMAEITPRTEAKALVVFSMRVQGNPLVDQVISNLRRVFADVAPIKLGHENESGGWFSCNFMFKETAVAVRERFSPQADSSTWEADGFYFFEADVTVLKPTWWDEMVLAYSQTTKPFMGKIRPTTEIDSGRNRGTHMNGSGVYPINLHSWSSFVFLADDVPWDVYAQDQIVPEAYDSPLFQILYERDPFKDMAEISEKAVVLHGCKDGSLIEILRKTAPKRPTAPIQAIPAAGGDIVGDLLNQLSHEQQEGLFQRLAVQIAMRKGGSSQPVIQSGLDTVYGKLPTDPDSNSGKCQLPEKAPMDTVPDKTPLSPEKERVARGKSVKEKKKEYMRQYMAKRQAKLKSEKQVPVPETAPQPENVVA